MKLLPSSLGGILMVLLFLGAINTSIAQNNNRTVSGTITDENGEALIGASVTVQGLSSGTITDVDGSYSLSVPETSSALEYAFLGYLTQAIQIDNRSIIDVVLTLDAQALDEVVVVGYGVQKSRSLTSAVSEMKGSEIAELPVLSADQALQGRASGVFISGDGTPGRNPTVRIRGLSSVLNSDPLFVVDGIPVGQDALNLVHPNNIENISVLKDAASTAIYGSRGANGVVLITTKKGKAGEGKLNLSAYYGIQSVPKSTHYDLLNTDQYINFARNTFEVNAPRFDDYDFASKSFKAGSASEEFMGVETDWQSELLQGGPIQDYYLSYVGGTDKVSYNVGGGYFDQSGVLVGTYFNRASINANVNVKLSSRLKVGNSTILARSRTNQEGRAAVREAIQMMPYIPVFDESRRGGFRASDFADNADPFQPILHSTITQDERTDTKLFNSAYAELEIVNGLFAKAQLGVENSFSQYGQFTPTFDAGEVEFNVNKNARVSRTATIYLSPVFTGTLNYIKTFSNHSINAIAGYERQVRNFESLNTGTDFLPNESVQNPGIAPIDAQRSSVFKSTSGIISYFGRLSYDYAGRYLLGASIRRDQSSIFAPENNVGVFPSVSAGWRIIEEPFMAGLQNIFSEMKIRASYGINGNTALNSYTWDPVVFSNTVYTLGDDQLTESLTVNRLFNRGIQWESVRKVNVGVDLELFDGKIFVSGEWFNNRTNDLIVEVPISPSTGYDYLPLGNIGDVENSGFELNLGYAERESALKWSLNANVSYIQNNVINLGLDKDANVSGANFHNTAVPATRAEAGEPIGFYYGWVVDKIYQTQSEIDTDNANAAQLQGSEEATRQGAAIVPGDIRFKDLNNDGIINGDDRQNIGHYLPDWNIGINGNASYKNFDLSLNAISAIGFEILNSNRFYTEGMTRLFNMGTEVLDAWSETNTDTDIPRANPAAGVNNARLSDRWVEKGDFFRIRFLTLGYTLPSIPSLPYSKLRIYGQAQNLLTLTGYSGYDPEVQGRRSGGASALFYNGVDDSFIPNPRTLIFGVQVSF